MRISQPVEKKILRIAAILMVMNGQLSPSIKGVINSCNSLFTGVNEIAHVTRTKKT